MSGDTGILKDVYVGKPKDQTSEDCMLMAIRKKRKGK